MNRLLYAVHKWFSLAVFVQLAIWTTTGFLFAATPQEKMKGAPVEGAHVATIDTAPATPIARVLERASPKIGAVERVELRGTPTGPYYLVKGHDATERFDARSGEPAPVTREEADATARRDQPGSPAVAESALLTESPPIDYRECEVGDCGLPVYRVALADGAHTVVYVDAVTGDVAARRNDAWRTNDFLWSLHIMDYRTREKINHPLLGGAAFLAMLTVLTGIVIHVVRFVRWTKKRFGSRLGRRDVDAARA